MNYSMYHNEIGVIYKSNNSIPMNPLCEDFYKPQKMYSEFIK